MLTIIGYASRRYMRAKSHRESCCSPAYAFQVLVGRRLINRRQLPSPPAGIRGGPGREAGSHGRLNRFSGSKVPRQPPQALFNYRTASGTVRACACWPCNVSIWPDVHHQEVELLFA